MSSIGTLSIYIELKDAYRDCGVTTEHLEIEADDREIRNVFKRTTREEQDR